MPNVHVRSISNPQARTKYLESLGTYEDSRAGPRHVRSISIPQARTKYLESLGTYGVSRGAPTRTLILARVSSLCPPEVVFCVGARVASGVVEGAGYVQVHVHVKVQVQVQVQVQVRGDAESFAFQLQAYSVFGVHVQVMVYFVCM